jgi:hypothetical protein
VCCIAALTPDASTAAVPVCILAGETCPPSLTIRVSCDEEADCQHGNVCCFNSSTGTQTCQAQCSTSVDQVCRCNQECSGASCTVCPGREHCGAGCG